MCLHCKVKVADVMEARVATTLPKYELSEMNQKDQASLGRMQKEVAPEEQDYELNQAMNSQGNGAVCGKQGTEESSMGGSQDDLVDSSIPSHNAMEEP